MNSHPRISLLEFVLLGVILLAGTGIRLWYVQAYAHDGPSLHVQAALGADWDTLVRNLNQGRGFVGGEEGQAPSRRLDVAPLYPWLIAQLAPAGGDLELIHQRARWLQCLLGGLTAGLLFLFAHLAFGSVLVAGIAGFAAALYPYWILSAAEVNDGVLAAFLLALVLFLAVRSRFEEFGPSWLLGMSLAALALTRAALLPFAIVCLLWFLRRCQLKKSRAAPALLVAFGFASGLAPWMIRNYEVAHDVVPIVDSTYLHLWRGTQAFGMGDQAWQRPSAGMNDHDRAVAVFMAWESDPAGMLRRRVWAALQFAFGLEPVLTAPAGLNANVALVLLTSLLALLALAFLGWRWSYPWRESAGPLTLAVLWIPLPYVLGAPEPLHGPRLPLDAAFICLAAYAVARLVVSIRGFRISRPMSEPSG